MSETLRVIEERSSIRAYKKEKLSKEQIDILVNAILQAPTAKNAREIHVSVLEGEHPVLAEIEKETRYILAENAASEEGKKQTLERTGNFYFDAPTVLILSAPKDYEWSKIDAGIAVENAHLAAKDIKLGSLIIGIIRGAFEGSKKEHFAKTLGFPEGYEFEIALAAGYPDTTKEPHTYEFEQQVSYINQNNTDSFNSR